MPAKIRTKSGSNYLDTATFPVVTGVSSPTVREGDWTSDADPYLRCPSLTVGPLTRRVTLALVMVSSRLRG